MQPTPTLLPEIAAVFKQIEHSAEVQGHPVRLRLVQDAVGLEPIVAIERFVPTNDIYPHYQWLYYTNTLEGLAAIRTDYAAYL